MHKGKPKNRANAGLSHAYDVNLRRSVFPPIKWHKKTVRACAIFFIKN